MLPNIYEYAVVCPECRSKTVLVITETVCTLFTCSHCRSNIMLYKGSLHKIRDSFLKTIIKDYRTEECGTVIFTRKAKNSSEYITEDKIKVLKDTLNNSFYIEDFLKNL
jgi:hypothetical protein